MAKSRKGKKYNPYKAVTAHDDLNVRIKSRQFLIGWSVGLKQPVFFDLEGNILRGDDSIKIMCMSRPFNWSVLCIALCRKQTGENYMQSISVSAPDKFTYADLSDVLNTEQAKLIKNVNPLHLLNTGWVSSPAGLDVTPEIADKIMDNLKAWEWLAKWEVPQHDESEVNTFTN